MVCDWRWTGDMNWQWTHSELGTHTNELSEKRQSELLLLSCRSPACNWGRRHSKMQSGRCRSANIQKSRSRDPFTTHFDLILHFFSLGPLVANLCAKFEVSSFNRSRYMEGVPKFQKVGHLLSSTEVRLFTEIGRFAFLRTPWGT